MQQPFYEDCTHPGLINSVIVEGDSKINRGSVRGAQHGCLNFPRRIWRAGGERHNTTQFELNELVRGSSFEKLRRNNGLRMSRPTKH